MDENLLFLNFEGLDDSQVEQINGLLHPSNLSPEIEFPWTNSNEEDTITIKGTGSSLNVHAPVFETYVSKISNHIADPHYSEAISFNNGPSQILNNSVPLVNYSHDYSALSSRTVQQSSAYSNGTLGQHTFDTYNNQSYHEPPKTVNVDVEPKVQPTQEYVPAANFKLNPAVSCFIPSNFLNQQTASDGNHIPTVQPNDNWKSSVTPNDCKSSVTPKDCKSPETANDCKSAVAPNDCKSPVAPNDYKSPVAPNDYKSPVAPNDYRSPVTSKDCKSPVAHNDCKSPVTSETTENKKEEPCVEKEPVPQIKQNGIEQKVPQHSKTSTSNATVNAPKFEQSSASPSAPRSWADIVSRGQRTGEKGTSNKTSIEKENKAPKITEKEQEVENFSVDEDKLALTLGKYLHQLSLNFQPVFLQPRGLINRRNWCYIHATLQALLACPPFYTLLRNLPLAEGLDRGKSATPVIDSMMKVAQEFSQFDSSQEELQPGQPFQPDFIYDMLRDLKSDCLKGQQEDAEEFLSFILNGMHEEMVKIIKNYENKNHLNITTEVKENGDMSEGEEEWQVIGSKHKGMVTRKVAEHKTPISDLLGGQIKSFLTTSGSKTSASIQPFFTLQLDIQSENVTSVSEALKEMTMKEPILGYTCAKTKQEVEAYSHVALQKLPPILILHLKRFVYNKNGGCKKVMKKTDYPIELELSKDLFSSDVKKNHRIRLYKLFAVMYHDGEEAVKGHYISDVYNHGSQTWVRCDDRTISVVSEAQVLSHSPPRVPYLLFYQES